MSAVKTVLRTVIGLAVVLAVLSFLLPRHAHVERSIIMTAPASTVFEYINDLRQFNKWSPWAQIDPATRYAFTGSASGVGAIMTWQSEHPHVGSGSQEIIESVTNEHVTTRLNFGDEDDATSTITLAPESNGTRVTWRFDSDLGFNPVSRYFGLMLDSMVGSNYEQGLASLKSLVEASGGQTGTLTPQQNQ